MRGWSPVPWSGADMRSSLWESFADPEDAILLEDERNLVAQAGYPALIAGLVWLADYFRTWGQLWAAGLCFVFALALLLPFTDSLWKRSYLSDGRFIERGRFGAVVTDISLKEVRVLKCYEGRWGAEYGTIRMADGREFDVPLDDPAAVEAYLRRFNPSLDVVEPIPRSFR